MSDSLDKALDSQRNKVNAYKFSWEICLSRKSYPRGSFFASKYSTIDCELKRFATSHAVSPAWKNDDGRRSLDSSMGVWASTWPLSTRERTVSKSPATHAKYKLERRGRGRKM